MATFHKGNMWSAYTRAGLFLITTNATLKNNGALVMGAGIAKQARDSYPGLDLALGAAIKNTCGNLGTYGLLISPEWPNKKLGCFQVKHLFNMPAQMHLIETATNMLMVWCMGAPDTEVHLNFPGIGNGGLDRAEVLPIVSRLPDQVNIWEYANEA